MAHHGSKFVKCPFYHDHDDNRIKCEGVYKGNTIHLVFEDSNERGDFMRGHCNSISLCQSCIIHKMLYDKWENG